MRDISFYLLFLSAIVPIIQAYRNPEEIYKLPFLYSIASLVYILPTLFGVKDNNVILSDSEYIHFTLYSFICFWAAIAGYRLYRIKEETTLRKPHTYNENKMASALYVIMVIALAAVAVAGNYDPSIRNGGSYAVLVYILRLLRPATIMLFIICLLKPSKDKVFFLILSLIASLKMIVIDGRRSEVFNLFITVAFPLFFIKNKIAPRNSIVPAILISLFVLTFLPAARQYTLQGKFSSVLDLSVKDLIVSQITAESTNEVVEAARNMEVAEKSGNYNYGSTIYNVFITQFAASTFFGKDFKNSLLIKSNLDLSELRDKYSKSEDDYYRDYLFTTGPGAVFFEFGYPGFLFFFIFGALAKRLFKKAELKNDISLIIFYCFFATFILSSFIDSMFYIPTNIILYLLVFWVTKRYSQISHYNT